MTGAHDVPLGLLPGVRRHVARLRSDLSAGRSVVWLLPRSLCSPERTGRLVDLLDDGHLARVEAPPAPAPAEPAPPPARPAPPGAGLLDAALSAHFAQLDEHEAPRPPVVRPAPGCASPAERALRALTRFTGVEPDPAATDPVEALASVPVPAGTTLVLPADAEHDRARLAALVSRYPAATRERRARGGNAAVLLVVGSVDATSPTGALDPLTTAVHWWWGVLTRLDLLVVASGEPGPVDGDRSGFYTDLVPEVIAEVAGPDLGTAAHLARHWDGTAASLTALVADVRARAAGVAAHAVTGRPAGERPPPEAVEAWSAGLVERWDGMIRPTLHGVGPDLLAGEVAERRWIGQARALNPVLDRLRRLIVDDLAARAPSYLMTELNRTWCNGLGVHTIELNELQNAVRQGTVTLGRRHHDLLRKATFVRNLLAHRRPVADADLDALVRLARQALPP